MYRITFINKIIVWDQKTKELTKINYIIAENIEWVNKKKFLKVGVLLVPVSNIAGIQHLESDSKKSVGCITKKKV